MQLGGTFVGVRALRGGTSSAVHLVTVALPDGRRHRAVLRRYVRPEVNEEEPDIAEREARTLRFVEGVGVPTPVLLAVDPTGEDAGSPSLLMSSLLGKVDWWPADLETWLRRLAELPPLIHAAPDPPPGAFPTFEPYTQDSYEPPPAAARREVWERAVELALGPPPALPVRFLQRDFHPGNVLWSRGRVSGVVDWQAACLGPSVVDVGHCRVNLLRFGLDATIRFGELWEERSGLEYHPWADVVGVIGVLDGLREEWSSSCPPAEELLARALAEIGA